MKTETSKNSSNWISSKQHYQGSCQSQKSDSITQGKNFSDKTFESSAEKSHLDSSIVIARNNIKNPPPGVNVTNNPDEGHYDPFFHKSKLSNSEEENKIKSNTTSNSWMDDRVCILNFFGLFFAFFIVMIILVLVVGVSFAN